MKVIFKSIPLSIFLHCYAILISLQQERSVTMKGTITRRLAQVHTTLSETFATTYHRRDIETAYRELVAAGQRSNRASLCTRLVGMLRASGIECLDRQDTRYYRELLDTATLPDEPQLEQRILTALLENYMQYPAPGDYLQRLVDQLCNPADGWNDDPLRLRILKQFVKYTDYLVDADFNGKPYLTGWVKKITGKKPASSADAANALTDEVFAPLPAADKSQRKPRGKYGLLKLAEDLAEGRFRAGGATRRGLYLFAVAFDMSFYCGQDAAIRDEERDIETNLFQKYYTNNLLRFLSAKETLSAYDLDPSGIGINYKNFAELCYLYVLSRPGGTPLDKLRQAESLLARAADERIPSPIPMPEQPMRTVQFRELVWQAGDDLSAESILSLPEEDFLDFLRCYYDRQLTRGKQTLNPFELQSEQHTAFALYTEKLKTLRTMLEEQGDQEENFNYGLWLNAGALPEASQAADFRLLLERVDAHLRSVWQLHTVETVTRSTLLGLCGYEYNALHFDDGPKNYQTVFLQLAALANPLLEQAGMMPFSAENFFDLVLAFSSYAYLNV